ncbi:hypothetical protein [Moraxella catarrhalis]|uniref:hypothetical protein n=2 Tax=Moraxella catarrhalis TaxID=480 RepID=UPI000A751C94|nr:hypothetical protein [Moraxella catarrhalis]
MNYHPLKGMVVHTLLDSKINQAQELLERTLHLYAQACHQALSPHACGLLLLLFTADFAANNQLCAALIKPRFYRITKLISTTWPTTGKTTNPLLQVIGILDNAHRFDTERI